MFSIPPCIILSATFPPTIFPIRLATYGSTLNIHPWIDGRNNLLLMENAALGWVIAVCDMMNQLKIDKSTICDWMIWLAATQRRFCKNVKNHGTQPFMLKILSLSALYLLVHLDNARENMSVTRK
jgi:hypothetical protein